MWKAKKRRKGGSDEGERVEVKESKNDDGEDYFENRRNWLWVKVCGNYGQSVGMP
jgi:hypothetical protein